MKLISVEAAAVCMGVSVAWVNAMIERYELQAEPTVSGYLVDLEYIQAQGWDYVERRSAGAQSNLTSILIATGNATFH